MLYKSIFLNKKIIITGHTGFKGSWLTLWLTLLGADIFGISKNRPSRPSHYHSLNLKKNIKEAFYDLKDTDRTIKLFKKINPDFVFHLAAQAIVKKSYLNPTDTWITNLVGTLSILEGLKNLKKKCVSVIITSDKVYKNLETEKGYKENDVLGGYDPYSASKGATEFLVNSYIKSIFFKNSNLRVSVARAGNVIGGGDWSEERLIPDCMRSWSKNKPVNIRSSNSTRPWQHVLEVIWGYITLAKKLNNNKKLHGEAFNFGPKIKLRLTVLELLGLMKIIWKNVSWKISKKKSFKESKLLKLNSKKAKKYLNWECSLNLQQTISFLLDWYKNYYFGNKNVREFSTQQIKLYLKILRKNKK